MTYSTLMVHLELEHSNDARLQIAGDLAERFNAKLIGIAAADPQPAYYADGAFAQGLVGADRSQIEERIVETEARFRSEMQHRACDTNGDRRSLGPWIMFPSKHAPRILSLRVPIGTDCFSILSGVSILVIW